MTDFVVDKDLITKKVLSILHPNFSDIDYNKVKFSIWWKVNNGGLRLTVDGIKIFEMAGIEHFDFNVDKTNVLSGEILLKMDRYLLCPYYLSTEKKFVRLYDSRIASLTTLHGDIIKYVHSLDTKRTDLTINSKL